jgi:hypothetical protein
VTGRIHVERTLHEMHNGSVILGPPKSAAGTRYVHLPRPAMIAVMAHLDDFVDAETDAPPPREPDRRPSASPDPRDRLASGPHQREPSRHAFS